MFARLAALSPVRQFLNWDRLRNPPVSGPVFLVHRRVYILPTRSGFAFAFSLLLMLVGSINYSLSLGYLMTFLLTGMAGVAMLHTYRNQVHLRVDPGKVENCFTGDTAYFELHFHNPSHYERISIDVLGADRALRCDIPRRGGAQVSLPLRAAKRGWLPLPRLTVETRYPLGLFRAWSILRLDMRALAYPQPDTAELPPPAVAPAQGEALDNSRGSDDFFGLRPYQAGDSLRHIAWKNVARSDLLLTKIFAGRGASELTFDFSALPPMMNVEARLSRLARWVMLADAQALQYSLRLPDRQIDAASGDAHRDECLRALALFGIPA